MKHVVIIGAGPAGLEAAHQLSRNGIFVHLIERQNTVGGHLRQWDRLFPTQEPAENVLKTLDRTQDPNIRLYLDTEVKQIIPELPHYRIQLSKNTAISADAVLFCNGFDTFRAQRKEEYGYGIYDNVFTSADIEQRFKEHRVLCKDGREPESIAFVHCVGSRDEKVGNRHCSKVCCVTGVKQACELKTLYPKAKIYNLYMDLRMFDRQFEDLYHRAQTDYHIQFIRGRLSEAAETIDHRISLKAEDTLLGKPLKITVDMLILLVGMECACGASDQANSIGIPLGSDAFLQPKDIYTQANHSAQKGLFLAGTCSGPKTLPETLADARSAAIEILHFLKD